MKIKEQEPYVELKYKNRNGGFYVPMSIALILMINNKELYYENPLHGSGMETA